MNKSSILIVILDFSEWTQTLCKFLREQLQKLSEHHNNSASNSNSGSLLSSSANSLNPLGSGSAQNSSSTLGSNSLNGVTIEVAYKQWQYCTQLARHLYEVQYFTYFYNYMLNLNYAILCKFLLRRLLNEKGYPQTYVQYLYLKQNNF